MLCWRRERDLMFPRYRRFRRNLWPGERGVKIFRSLLIKTEICKVCRSLKLTTKVCTSQACQRGRKLAR